MARKKIDYGIYLGTSYAAICRIDKGEPVIIKTDTLQDTMPICVAINRKGGIKVGHNAYSSMKSDKRRGTKYWKSNNFVDFTRNIGTDKRYFCPNANKYFTSEELSAEVLKTLKSFVTDETFRSVVITVPAKFTVNQKTATIEAAKMTGFDRCELLQEPIAASFAYGLTSEQKNGIWMVFDFDGGTFDATLLRVEDGIMQVFDTAGDNYLGGKDLDAAIVEKIIIPYLKNNYSIDEILSDKEKSAVLRDAMKTYAEDVKSQLSFKDKEFILSNLGDLWEDDEGEEIELDLSVTQTQVFDAMRPVFQKAVDICADMLTRNKITKDNINKLILVGNDTQSPLLHKMLKEQVTPNIDDSIDPVTVIAQGAALYAATIDNEENEYDMETSMVKLDIGYETTSVEQSEWVSIRLDRKATGDYCPEKVIVQFIRNDGAWKSDNTEIDELGNVVELMLLDRAANTFKINVFNIKGDRLPCSPSEITISVNGGISAAPLPYNIGIAVWNDRKKKNIFQVAKGLEKNNPIPAVGVINGLRTKQQIRPGYSIDKLSIQIYQCEDEPENGRSVDLYEYVADVFVTGDEVESLIPENSPVDITLKVDASEQISYEIYFPKQDFTIVKTLNTSKKMSIDDINQQIKKILKTAQYTICKLDDYGIDMSYLQDALDNVRAENKTSQEKNCVLQNLKNVCRKIEDLENETEWIRIEKDINERLDQLSNIQQIVNVIQTQAAKIIKSKDLGVGDYLLERLNALNAVVTMFKYKQ